MVVKAPAVEHDRRDAGLLRAAGEQRRDGLGSFDVAAGRVARRAGSTDEAATRVRPSTSSMIWAEKCLLGVRLTATRGRSGVPERCWRTRRWRR